MLISNPEETERKIVQGRPPVAARKMRNHHADGVIAHTIFNSLGASIEVASACVFPRHRVDGRPRPAPGGAIHESPLHRP